MAYLATAVANDFLNFAASEGCSLSQMQVQKLVYFSHGWNLALRGEALTAEPFEAWDYGPVIRRLWERLRKYGSKSVGEKIEDYVFDEGQFKTVIASVETSPDPNAPATMDVIRGVWKQYGRYSGSQLSTLTHIPEGPWAEARTNKLPFIPNSSIEAYFKTLRRG